MEVICELCGAANPPGSRFCRGCDAFLAWGDAGTTPAPTRGRDVVGGSVSRRPRDPYAMPDGLPTIRGPDGARPASSWAGSAASPEPVRTSPAHIAPLRVAGNLRCGYCGSPVDASWRFCRRCGHPTHRSPESSPAEGTAPPARQRWWRSRSTAEERAARAAYRRSLPPLYRWRRVALAAALVLGAVVAFTRIGSNPIAFAASTWWELRDEVVEVEHVRASTVVGGATSPSHRGRRERCGSQPFHRLVGAMDRPRPRHTMRPAGHGRVPSAGAAPDPGAQAACRQRCGGPVKEEPAAVAQDALRVHVGRSVHRRGP